MQGALFVFMLEERQWQLSATAFVPGFVVDVVVEVGRQAGPEHTKIERELGRDWCISSRIQKHPDFVAGSLWPRDAPNKRTWASDQRTPSTPCI